MKSSVASTRPIPVNNETPAASAEADGEIIRDEMTRAMALRVPLKVDLGVGGNWRDAK